MKNKVIGGFVVCFLFLLTPLRAAAPAGEFHAVTAPRHASAPSLLPQDASLNFDFDDNLVSTPAHIRLWHRATGKECDVSTADWALIRQKVGVEGFWKEFEVKVPQSLVEFTDQYSVADYVKEVLAQKGESALGLGFAGFREALSDPKTRARTTIISAEEHSDKAFMAALQVLKDRGLIPALPAKLYIVGGPDFPASLKGKDSAESKAKVMEKILKDLNGTEPPEGAVPIENQDGTGKAKLHPFYFYDDDYGNITTALSTLAPKVKEWPNVKIFLCFTGKNNPDEDPRAMVIKSDGTTRPALSHEPTFMPRDINLPSREERRQHLLELEKSCS